MLRSRNDEDQVNLPGCNVDWCAGRAREQASDCADDASETRRAAAAGCLPAELARGKPEHDSAKPSIAMPLRSSSRPPRHDEGVQPFTIASIHDTRWAAPTVDEMVSRLIGRSSPPHPAHNYKWKASRMSTEKWKSHKLSVLLSCAAVVYVTPQSKYSLFARRGSVMRR